jgi:heat shock protein HtpX
VLHRDVLISTIAATVAGAISILARMAGWALMLGQGRAGDGERGPNPLGTLFLALVTPLLALVLQFAVSRSREYGADATGARLSGAPEALASALAKLHAVASEVPMRTADPATSHLYIVRPLAGAASALVRLFSTHPPVINLRERSTRPARPRGRKERSRPRGPARRGGPASGRSTPRSSRERTRAAPGNRPAGSRLS